MIHAFACFVEDEHFLKPALTSRLVLRKMVCHAAMREE
jgi:hypothetical protein